MTTGKLQLMDMLAALGVAAAVSGPSVWARLYWYTNSPGFLLAVTLLLCLIVYGTLICVGRIWMALSPTLLLRGLTVGGAAVWGGMVLSEGILSRSPASLLVPLGLLGTVGGLLLLRQDWLARLWLRLRTALLVGGFLFFLSAPIVGGLASQQLAMFKPLPAESRHPTVWLLLDETSFGAAEELAKPLLDRKVWTRSFQLEHAGNSTLDIVPSILGRVRMGGTTAPCGLTVLCATRRSVDFANIVAGRDDVDIVGSYHRYCEILGLRTCAHDLRRSDSWIDQFNALRCRAIKLMGSLVMEAREACLRDEAKFDLNSRKAVIAAAMTAPFWQQGGDLFVHVLLPHMPAAAEARSSLGAAYEENIEQAAKLINAIAERLSRSFPKDYRLVVFSDHPLRPMGDCSSLYSWNCERPSKYAEPYAVPLIVAAPQPLAIHAPASNMGVFDLRLDAAVP